jgi:hypothetical protein
MSGAPAKIPMQRGLTSITFETPQKKRKRSTTTKEPTEVKMEELEEEEDQVEMKSIIPTRQRALIIVECNPKDLDDIKRYIEKNKKVISITRTTHK